MALIPTSAGAGRYVRTLESVRPLMSCQQSAVAGIVRLEIRGLSLQTMEEPLNC